jgi:hypothetical protein
MRWIITAQDEGYDALILLIDEDGQRERRQQFDNAQNYQKVNLPRAIGVAIHSFDAWFLADEKALSEVMNCQISPQPNPETISDPKKRCSDLRNESCCERSLRELYLEIAKIINLDLLYDRCPHGFALFADRVRSLL